MSLNLNRVKVVQDVDQAIAVIHSASTWLEKSGKKISKWWQPKNINREFLLKHAESEDFYAFLIDGEPAAAVVFQDNERNQSWQIVDKDEPKSALYIHWLSVERQFAGVGLPKTIVDFASKYARERNLKLLRLDTDADETKLLKVYDDLGFQLMGTEQEGDFKTAFYQKQL